MAITVKHSKVSTVPDAGDDTLVEPSDWNADHVLTGTIPVTNGGTGADNATDARTNLGAAASGANSDITSMTGITGGISSPDFVQFDTGITPVVGVGKLQWDTDAGGLQVGMIGGNVNLQIGQESVQRVYNNTGSTLTDGQIVYVTGAQGQRLTVALALADADSTSATIIGMVTESIANNSSGFITVEGIVNNVNTNGIADGTILWLSPTTAGAYTATKPVAPDHLVMVGYVVKGNSTGAGSIFVKVQNGYELSELHDVLISSPTTGQQLVYNATTEVWQNSNAPTISGGTIDNTPIGSTTASTGKFTTLESSGQTKLAVTSGYPAVQVDTGTSTGQYTLFSRNSGTNTQKITAANSANLALQATGGGGIYFRTADDSATQLLVSNTGSAVNYVQATGGATGNAVTISAQGSDTNVPMAITSKGSSAIRLQTGSGTNQVFVQHSASAVNYLGLSGSATGVPVYIQAFGSDTNVPLVLMPKGTGALQAQMNDATATGGNTRGTNAVDWQTSRSAASQVASGSYSFIGGGLGNTVNNTLSTIAAGSGNTISNGVYSSILGGRSNSVTADYASVVGGYSNSSTGFFNFIGGGFTNSGTSAAAVTTQSGTMNGTTAVTLSGSNASIKVGQLIAGTSIATNTYVAAISGTSLTLSQAASGSSTSTLSFYTPHGVVVGGGNNQATGSYSFIGGGGDAGTAANRNTASGDWSSVLGGITNTASGNYSVSIGGANNGASAAYSVCLGGSGNGASGFGGTTLGGNGNTANGVYSLASGFSSTTRSIASFAFAGGSATVGGDAQTRLFVLRSATTDATATTMTVNAAAASTTNQVVLPNNSAFYFRGEIIAGVTGAGNTKGWFIEGAIKRGANAGSTVLVGTPTVTSSYADAGASTWAIAVTADTTNGCLKIAFTGQAATTIRTVAQIRTTEMTY